MALHQWLPRCVRPTKKSRKSSLRASTPRKTAGMLRVESLEGRIVPTTINVPGPFGPTIQAAINAANSGDTIQVAAGLYQENLTIPGTLTSLILQGANAGTQGSSGSRASESIIEASGNTTAVVSVKASNVTINGFTINGDDPSVTGAALFSGHDTNSSYGITNIVGGATQINNLLIENNIIENTFIGTRLFGASGVSTGSLITRNWYHDIGNFDFGYSVSLGVNYYADVTNNLMTKTWTGFHLNNFNGAGGPGSWTISGNTVQSYASGLDYWLEYNGATGLTFTNNQLSAETGAVANNFGILMVSIQDAVNPSFTSNTITGTDYGVGLTNTSTSNIVTLGATNSITGTKTAGVYLTDNLTFNPVGTTNLAALGDTTPIAVNLSGVSITGSLGAGVLVQASRGTGDVATTVTVSGATTISGTSGTIGVDVEGPTAIASLAGAAISGFATGIKDNGGTVTFNAGDTVTGGATGLLITGAGSAVTGNTLNNVAFSGQSGQYITLSSGALFGLTENATSATFGGVTGAGSGLAGNFTIEDKITHAVDNGTLGFVRVTANQLYVTPTSANIQLGINAAASGDTVNVEAGTYIASQHIVDSNDGVVFELMIDRPLTLLGSNPNYDPNVSTVPANPQTIILPGESDPNPFSSTAVIIVGVSSSNVTIKGFTIDGSNPTLNSDPKTFVYNSVHISASEGIASYANIGNITVQGNIVQNTGYTGVDFQNATFNQSGIVATTNNSITKNYMDNLGGGGYGYGVGVVIYNNFYAAVTNNVIDVVRVGVQTGNYYLANPGGAGTAVINHNSLEAVRHGIFYNLHYGSASPFLVNNNTITAFEDSTSGPLWDGIFISSQEQNVSATFSGNWINGSGTASNPSQLTAGVTSWNTTTSGSLLVDSGTIQNVDYGVWVNTFEGYASNADGSQVTVNGANISARQIGVYVEQSPANTNPTPAHASATIQGGTTISTASGIGVKVSGSVASATITGSSITNNATGVEVDGGTANVQSSFVNANGVGVSATDAVTTPSVTLLNNDLSGNTTTVSNTSASAIVDASGNWFGTTAIPAISPKMSGAVDYSPILVTGDSSVSPGFQGDFSTLIVHTAGAQIGGSPIQNGIDLLANGALTGSARTVIVLPGTYVGDVDFNKAGTLSPGGSGTVATVSVTGNLTFSNSYSILQMDVISPYTTAGTNYDHLNVSGNFNFANGTLTTPGGGAFAPITSAITLVSVPTGTTTPGTHPAQGATLTIGANQFIASYTAGAHSNDFALLSTPVIINPTATNIGTLTATLGGNIISAGSSPLIKRGVIYSTNPNPLLSPTEVDVAPPAVGVFTAQINGLTPNTHYYFVAFATSDQGPVYTSPVSDFMTGTGPGTTITTTNPGNAGQVNHSMPFTLSAFDPAPGMQAYFFVFHINWGDGKTENVTGHSPTAYSHTYSKTGTFLITIAATDGRGTTLPGGTLTVVITSNPPAAPAALIGGGNGGTSSGLKTFAATPSIGGGVGSSSGASNSSNSTFGSALTQSLNNGSAANSLALILAAGNSNKSDSVVDSLFGNSELRNILG